MHVTTKLNLDKNQNEDTATPEGPVHVRTKQPLTRNRQRHPTSWKSSVRKKLRQSGKEYVDSRGKIQKAREIKTTKNCARCRFKCSQNVSELERKSLFDDFWAMDDYQKMHFYSKTTTCQTAKRKRTQAESSRKNKSFMYYLPCDEQNVRVCKDFYLDTLAISPTRINNFHRKKQDIGSPAPLL